MGDNPVNVIRKPPPDQISPAPRLLDYEAGRRDFSAESIDAELGLRADGPCNLGALAAQRQVALGRGDANALRWFGRGDERKLLTYTELAACSGKFANMLKNFGVHKGDSVFFLTGTVPELFWGMVGTALYGAVGGILNPRGNSDYYHHILSHSKAKLLVVSTEFKPVIDGMRKSLPDLWQVVVLAKDNAPGKMGAGDFIYADYYGPSEESFEAAPTKRDAPALVHYTDLGMSGVAHRHGIAAPLLTSTRYALDLGPDDNMAAMFPPTDPAFLPYSIFGPFLVGACVLVPEEPIQMPLGYERFAKKFPIEVWFSPPQAIDVLLRRDPDLALVLAGARHIAVTHPSDPGFVQMTEPSFGSPLHTVWWPRELGAIQCGDLRVGDIHPGSAGLPLPGVEVSMVDDKVAIKNGWSSGFAGYWKDEGRTSKAIQDGWFVTSKRGTIDSKGYVWV